MVLQVWGVSSGPYMQALEFCMAIGGMCGALLLEVITGSKNQSGTQSEICKIQHMKSKDELNITGNIDTSFYHTDQNNASMLESVFQNTSRKTDNETLPGISDKSHFEYLYLTIGIYLFLTALLLFVLSRRKPIVDNDNDAVSNSKQMQTDKNGKTNSKYLIMGIVACLLIFYFFYIGLHTTYTGLITTFSVTHLCWPRSHGNLLPAINWGTTAFSKFVCIFLSRWIGPARIMLCCISIIIGLLTLLSFIIDKGPYVLWIFVAIFGLIFAPIFPSTFTWLNNHVEVTGKLLAILHMSIGLGVVGFTTLTSWLFEHVHPLWFLYMLVIGSTVSAIALYMAVHFGNRLGERFTYQRNAPVNEDNGVVITLVDGHREDLTK